MIKIIDVQLQTTYAWDEVRKRDLTWQNLKNNCSDWRELTQTTLISQSVDIKVDLVENNWAGVYSLYATWDDVKNGLSSWQELKDF
ncbi:hypothetical protein SAMN05660649_04253 [Desulfotomaculum arcticum]|uniref:Uncharacterized protein n=1 Tax=Desulfotruncus arcticus DSM 17038 TaxID=1121424 RepID=A0A1I2Y5V9_9FIRM|nr:hypothetical protein [Desulfotruncus arcticus]SFH20992.1 hypothetical protein SAMN05660649_04253 [Desulfotomaculum arcticum] [Desulfotruncus arcticus DSM 17038]